MPKGIKGFIKNYIPWNKGKKTSKETKEKMSDSHKRKGSGKWMKTKLGPESNRWSGGGDGWRKRQAKIRDDYTCQICGLRDIEIMQVDHIKPKGRYPELAREMDNLLTLCPNCHFRKTIRDHKDKLDKANLITTVT